MIISQLRPFYRFHYNTNRGKNQTTFRIFADHRQNTKSSAEAELFVYRSNSKKKLSLPMLKKSQSYAIIRKKRDAIFMKIHGVKREWSYPIFCMKKHYCPYCNERLEKTKRKPLLIQNRKKQKTMIFQMVMVF